MNSTSIHFAVFPVRAVSPVTDPYAYLDERGQPQIHDSRTLVTDSGIQGVIHWSGGLDSDDVAAVRTILVAIAIERHGARDAERARCAKATREEADGCEVGGDGHDLAARILRAIEGA